MDSLIQTFDHLLAIRERAAANKGDGYAQFLQFCAANIGHSTAQLFQDLFVIFILRNRTGGYFVEFGATNGIELSNTYVLEKMLRWKGLLAEPARCWHEALSKNRSAIIDRRCVWDRSEATIDFLETKIAELSTIGEFRDRDGHKENRREGTSYPVETIALNDLLAQHHAPEHIDYLSIDTEGSELQILEAFNFEKYAVDIITVEHNFAEPDRSKINELLAAKGFGRLFECFSKWDDWYVQRAVLEEQIRLG
jgi:FkbM family methyltransferase